MGKKFSLKKLFISILLIIPFIYIGFGWYIGLSYGRKGVVLGPFADVPVVMKTSLLGSSLEAISGAKALVMVVPPKEAVNPDPDSTYFKIAGYFELPGVWNFEFQERNFTMTGNYSRAIVHEVRNPRKRLGSFSVFELQDFLQVAGRSGEIKKLEPYLFLAKLEEKYPWLYSDTILVSKAMGNIFKDNGLPYDVLGLIGIVIFFVVMATRSFWLWFYYLFWVFACWFGRIGYHDVNLTFSNDGWQVILWSFWNGFILKEGRLFLMVAVGVSVIFFGFASLEHVIKRIFKRELAICKCNTSGYRK